MKEVPASPAVLEPGALKVLSQVPVTESRTHQERVTRLEQLCASTADV